MSISIYIIFIIHQVFFNLCKHIRNHSPKINDFDEFIVKYSRQYQTTEEYKFRKTIFEFNVALIDAHNSLSTTYKLGINEFADLTETEFIISHHINNFGANKSVGYKIRERNTLNDRKYANSQNINNSTIFNVPDTWDWISYGGVTDVMNEGECTSNYAISAIGGVEGAYYAKYKVLKSFSTQQVVDCSDDYGSGGCSGGLIRDSLEYIRDIGICLESEYPYQARRGQCRKACKVVTKPIGWEAVPYGDYELQRSIYYRPTSVSINIIPLRFYSSGIFTGDCDYTDLNHAVLGVSYSSESISIDNNITDRNSSRIIQYFRFKNSWGYNWGENGYFRVVRGEGNLYGKCGCSTDNYFAKF